MERFLNTGHIRLSDTSRPPDPEAPISENFSLTMTMADPESTPERFELYRKYQMAVHNDPPDEITEAGFKRFLVESPLVDARSEAIQRTAKTKFGTFHQLYRLNGRLIAVGVVDILPNSVSSVYLFYDPDERHLVLGKYTALQEIEFCKSVGLEYYVMGFYIHSCVKMRYKGEYKPSELLCPTTLEWVPLSESTSILNKFNFSPLEPHLAAQRALIPVGMYRSEVREDGEGEGEGEIGSDTEKRGGGDEGGGSAAEALGDRGDGHAEHEGVGEGGGGETPTKVTTVASAIGDDEAGGSQTEISSRTNSTPAPSPAEDVSREKRDGKGADSHETEAEAALREQLVDFVAEFDFGASNISAPSASSTKGLSKTPSPWTLVSKADLRRSASDGAAGSGGGGGDGTLSSGSRSGTIAAAPSGLVRARRDFVASVPLDVGAGRPLHITHLTEQGKRIVEPLLEEWVQLAGPVAKHIVVKFC